MGAWKDLNPRPVESQSTALPTKLQAPKILILSRKCIINVIIIKW